MSTQTQPDDTEHTLQASWHGLIVRGSSHDSCACVVDVNRSEYLDWLAEVATPDGQYASWTGAQRHAVNSTARYLATMQNGGLLRYGHVVRAFREEIADHLRTEGHVVTAAEEWSD